MNDFSFRGTPCNLRNFQSLYSDKRTFKFETETITYRGATDTKSYFRKHKKCVIFNTFKDIKNRNSDLCLYRICKTNIQLVGFI